MGGLERLECIECLECLECLERASRIGRSKSCQWREGGYNVELAPPMAGAGTGDFHVCVYVTHFGQRSDTAANIRHRDYER